MAQLDIIPGQRNAFKQASGGPSFLASVIMGLLDNHAHRARQGGGRGSFRMTEAPRKKLAGPDPREAEYLRDLDGL